MADTPDAIDLTFLAKQNERVIRDIASLKDDLNVLTSIVLRLDGTVTGLLHETRATHSQMQRLKNRVEKLEDANNQF